MFIDPSDDDDPVHVAQTIAPYVINFPDPIVGILTLESSVTPVTPVSIISSVDLYSSCRTVSLNLAR